MAGAAGPNGQLVDWLVSEVDAPGVSVATGTTVTADELDGFDAVVQCTGARAGVAEYAVGDGVVEAGRLLDVGALRLGRVAVPVDGDIVLFDPIGGPIAVALAEELRDRAILVTQDQIAGNELSRTGDLAPANARLAQAGVRIMRRSLLRAVRLTDAGLEIDVADRFQQRTATVTAAAMVDCGFRLPTEPLAGATVAAGDCVAPRTVLEAILEGRRAARSIG
jgi:hypothetical protein